MASGSARGYPGGWRKGRERRVGVPCHPSPQSANALTFDEIQGLTYLQVKGTGVANTCPVLESGTTNLKELKAGTYKLQNFCVEPTSFTVKEESQFKNGETEFVKTKLMTRLTYTLDAVGAPVGWTAAIAPRAPLVFAGLPTAPCSTRSHVCLRRVCVAADVRHPQGRQRRLGGAEGGRRH
jgi:hypothetical protein